MTCLTRHAAKLQKNRQNPAEQKGYFARFFKPLAIYGV